MRVETGRELVVSPLPGAAPYPLMVVRRVVTAVGESTGNNTPPRDGRQSTTADGRGRVVDLTV